MGLPRPRAELGMELTGDEVGVLRDLDDLDQLLLGPDAGDAQHVLLQAREVVVVHLVPVTVTLLDDPLPVQARGMAPLAQDDRVEPQAHRAALVGQPALLREEIDHQVRRGRVELRRAGPAQPTHGASPRASLAIARWASASTRLL